VKLRGRNGRDRKPYARLDALAAGLKDHERQLAEAEEAVTQAEEREHQLDALAADLVEGTISAPEFERIRAERTHNVVEARGRRDGLRAIVKAAKAAFEEELRDLARAEQETCVAERKNLERELGEAQARVAALEAGLQLVEERWLSFDYLREGDGFLALRGRYDDRALDRIDRRREDAKRERARHDETALERAARHEAETAAALAAQVRDSDGNAHGAYARVPRGDEGPTRLPDAFQPRRWERR
jgi:hypothetical protein